MSKRTIAGLKCMQAAPLDVKIRMTESRIRDWVNEYGEDGVFVSFSGGKDSTVLLDIVRKNYPNIPAVFMDTGLEFPEVRAKVKATDNVTFLKPKMMFRETIQKYGYPLFGKEIAEVVQNARTYLRKLAQDTIIATDRQTDRQTDSIVGKEVACIGFSESEDTPKINLLELAKKTDKWKMPYRVSVLLGQHEIYWKEKKAGIIPKDGEPSRVRYAMTRYAFMLEAPFDISHMCCYVMKKSPSHAYQKETGRNPITAQMASESKLRTSQWIRHGCNMFDAKNPISNPMSFWTEQDVLEYVREYGLSLAKVYGKIVDDTTGTDECQGQMTFSDCGGDERADRRCPLKTTGCSRTGCIFCGFGIGFDTERYAQIDVVSDPKLRDFCMRGGSFDEDGLWKPDNRGLGMWFVLKYSNIHGGFNITIPEFERYESEYGNDLTHAYLYDGKKWEYTATKL